MVGHATLVLGAGFSRPAGGPLLAELLSKESCARSAAAPEALGLLQDAPRTVADVSPNVEELFTDVWAAARTGGMFRSGLREFSGAGLLSELEVHLASVTAPVGLRRGTRLWNHYVDFARHAFENSDTLSIVTFNYDLLVEQILNDAGIPWNYGRFWNIHYEDERGVPSAADTRVVPVLKVHGSVNWGLCLGCSGWKGEGGAYAFTRPFIPNRRRRCPTCQERFLSSGIIPPIVGKAGEFRIHARIWAKAREHLRRARHVAAIGYSLPNSDREARSLLAEAVGGPKRVRLTVVCGPRGAPATFSTVWPDLVDAKCYFEDFVEWFPAKLPGR